MEERAPALLQSVDFVRVRFRLEFAEDYRLTLESALRLRRNLRQVLRLGGHPVGAGPFQQLFDPPLPSDPVAVRRFQRPSPLFVIVPPSDLPRELDVGDRIDLDVLFWGTGAQQLGDFLLVLQDLGRAGWHKGEGRFKVAQLDGMNPAGGWEPIWRAGQSPFTLAPPILCAAWWLEASAALEEPLRLTFLSPARILTEGRPLFRPTFIRLFPFILRRVTSMVYGCCGVELIDDPAPILMRASAVHEENSSLYWQDWRTLEGESSQQDLGGVAGSVDLRGEGLAEISWILTLGSLMNIGKGASYGAGHYSLSKRPLLLP